jgi:hypothetical protein
LIAYCKYAFNSLAELAAWANGPALTPILVLTLNFYKSFNNDYKLPFAVLVFAVNNKSTYIFCLDLFIIFLLSLNKKPS